MELLLVSFPKGLVLLELNISLYIRHYLSNSPMWDLVCYLTDGNWVFPSRPAPPRSSVQTGLSRTGPRWMRSCRRLTNPAPHSTWALRVGPRDVGSSYLHKRNNMWSLIEEEKLKRRKEMKKRKEKRREEEGESLIACKKDELCTRAYDCRLKGKKHKSPDHRLALFSVRKV